MILRRFPLTLALLFLLGGHLAQAEITSPFCDQSPCPSAESTAAPGLQIMQGKFFAFADWKDRQLPGANFKGSVLSQARFKNSNLSKADFTSANLIGADLRNANLSQAKLQGADLTWARLEGSILTGASYDKHTMFPTGFIPSDHQMIYVP